MTDVFAYGCLTATTSSLTQCLPVSVPLKKMDAVDVRKPIEKFVSTTFTDENAVALEEFSKMHESSVLRTLDRHESGLEPLFKVAVATKSLPELLFLRYAKLFPVISFRRYYDQLSAMEAKLLISESDVKTTLPHVVLCDVISIRWALKVQLKFTWYESCLLWTAKAMYKIDRIL